MRRAVLDQILRGLDSVSVQDTRLLIPEGLRVDLLTAPGHEVVPVSGARVIDLGETCVAVTTDKDETYYFEYDVVAGVRTKGKPSGRPVGRTGFAPE